MKKRYVQLIALTTMIALVASACSAGSSTSSGSGSLSSDTTTETPDPTSKTGPTDASLVTDDECEWSLPDEEITCGTLTVPENWDDPDEASVKLPYILLPALGDAADKKDDPIFYFEGGPGSESALASFEEFSRFDELRAGRDLIFLEYRGLNLSEPAFPCQTITRDDFESEGKRCWEASAELGMDPGQYNSINSAKDAQALRQELKIKAWNVWGISYGTTTAQLLSKVDPEATRTVTLDSPTSPSVEISRADVESQLDGLSVRFDACETDAACNAAYPDLRDKVERTYDELVTKPWAHGSVELAEFFGGPSLDSKTYLLTLVRIPPEVVPGFVHLVAERDAEALAELGSDDPGERQSEGEGEGELGSHDTGFPLDSLSESRLQWASVYCAEEAPFYDLDTKPLVTAEPWSDAITDFALAATDWDFCTAWPVPPADPEDVELVENNIATLILTGEFDMTTPKRQGEIVKEGLTNATLVDVPATTHGIVPQRICAEAIMVGFLNNPERELALDCLDEIDSITFA